MNVPGRSRELQASNSNKEATLLSFSVVLLGRILLMKTYGFVPTHKALAIPERAELEQGYSAVP